MKKNIHPQWNHNCQVSCACGNSFVTGSSNDKIKVDICSVCHPFFTNELKFVDRQGRIDNFLTKMNIAKSYQQKSLDRKKANPQVRVIKTYQEILREQKTKLRQTTAK